MNKEKAKELVKQFQKEVRKHTNKLVGLNAYEPEWRDAYLKDIQRSVETTLRRWFGPGVGGIDVAVRVDPENDSRAIVTLTATDDHSEKLLKQYQDRLEEDIQR